MSQVLLDELEKIAGNETCLTCECLQGALATLMVETGDATIRAGAKAMRVERGRIHSCLGCEPCPPADALLAFRARALHAGTPVIAESCGSDCGCGSG